MRQICITISERAPEFGIGTLLPELLQDTANWDIVLIGLRSLITILLNAPARHSAARSFIDTEVKLSNALPIFTFSEPNSSSIWGAAREG